MAAAALAALAALLASGRAGAAGTREVAGFAPNPGGLRMLVHLPPDGLPASGAALVVALHGCTQDAGTFAEASGWTGLADRLRFALLLPQQEAANNPDRCFNFFRDRDNRRGRGEAASIAAMVARARADHAALDPRRTYVVGLSAGGAMAAAMLAAYPELFAAGAVLAGVAYGCADTAGEPAALAWQRRAFLLAFPAYGEAGWAALACGIGREGVPPPAPFPRSPELWAERVQAAGGGAPAAWPRVSLWQGTADRTVNPGALEQLTRQWTAVHGVDAAAPEEDRAAGDPVRRRRYADARGAVRVESYLVEGLPHAVPVDPDASPPCGRPAPDDPRFVDDGLCAARLIARFWGLAPADG